MEDLGDNSKEDKKRFCYKEDSYNYFSQVSFCTNEQCCRERCVTCQKNIVDNDGDECEICSFNLDEAPKDTSLGAHICDYCDNVVDDFGLLSESENMCSSCISRCTCQKCKRRYYDPLDGSLCELCLRNIESFTTSCFRCGKELITEEKIIEDEVYCNECTKIK